MKRPTIVIGVLLLFSLLFFLANCRLVGYFLSGIERKANDPPAGVFLYEDDLVRIETGRYKLESRGGNGDNATYRYFMRSLLYDRDDIPFDSVQFNVDSYWDDYYIHVAYKTGNRRTVPALESIKQYLDPDDQMLIETQPDGSVIVTPPPPPKER